jgi:hypothetical protein
LRLYPRRVNLFELTCIHNKTISKLALQVKPADCLEPGGHPCPLGGGDDTSALLGKLIAGIEQAKAANLVENFTNRVRISAQSLDADYQPPLRGHIQELDRRPPNQHCDALQAAIVDLA